MPSAFRNTLRITAQGIAKARTVADADDRDPPRAPGGGAGGQPSSDEQARIQREAERGTSKVQQPSTQREREAEDMFDLTPDQLDNLSRIAAFALARVRETVTRATGRLGSPSDLDAYLGGRASGGARQVTEAEILREARESKRRALARWEATRAAQSGEDATGG
jgi:hypothetical protein